jgi:hypothetical protein
MSPGEARETITREAHSLHFPPIVDLSNLQFSQLSKDLKNIKVLGRCSKLQTTYKSEDLNDRKCPLFQDYCRDVGIDVDNLVSHIQAPRTKESFVKSILKCDVTPTLPHGAEKEQLFDVAKKYSLRMFAPVMARSKLTRDVEYNATTSPGIIWQKLGCKTKLDAIMHPEFKAYTDAHYLPIYSVLDKKEFLPKEDVINDGKIRTIFSPPTDFLLTQKIFTSDQNERFKAHCESYDTFWSRYGFVKQYGGLNRLATHHSKFDLHFTSDGSGWDRVFSLMPSVWDQRAYFLGDVAKSPAFQYVRDNIQSAYLCMPDGSLLHVNNVGNRSGSDTTTTDNCWGHTIIAFYLVLLIGWRKFGKILSYEEVLRYTKFSLYGDDNFGSLDNSIFRLTSDELKALVTEAYGDFGVRVKASQFFVQLGNDVSGLEFLGSTFFKANGHYYGLPRFGKLYTSLSRLLEKSKDKLPVCSCIASVYDIVADVPHTECEAFTSLLVGYATWLLDSDFSSGLSDECLNMLARVASRDSNLFSLLGYEAQYGVGFLNNVEQERFHPKARDQVRGSISEGDRQTL